jgi:hypothetical protein
MSDESESRPITLEMIEGHLKRIEKYLSRIEYQQRDPKTEAFRLLFLLPLSLGFNLIATAGITTTGIIIPQLFAGTILLSFGTWQFYRYTRR